MTGNSPLERAQAAEAAMARRSRRETLLHPRFWISHWGYAILLLLEIGAIGGSVFWAQQSGIRLPEEFTFDSLAILLTAGFFVAIAGACLWASRITAEALAETMIDETIARVIERDADEKLAGLGSRDSSRIDLDSIRQLIPENRSSPEPAMIRLAQELFKEAGGMRFDARFHLLPRVRAENSTFVFKLERLQRYSLRLGILGTFVGLLIALVTFSLVGPDPSSVSGELTTNGATSLSGAATLEAGTRYMFDALGFCFATSIAGLLASLLIAAQAEGLRFRQLRCGRRMEDATLSLVTLLSRTVHREDLLASLEESTIETRRLREEIYNQSQKVDRALGNLDKRISAQTAAIGVGMGQLRQAQGDFQQFLRGIRSVQSEFLAELAKNYDAKAIAQLIFRIEKAVGDAGTDLSTVVRSELSQVLVELKDRNGQLISANEDFLSDLAASFDRASLDKLVDSLPQSVNGLGNRFETLLGTSIGRLDQRFQDLGDTLQTMERDIATSSADLAVKATAASKSLGSIDAQISAAVNESRRALGEVPPTLRGLQESIDDARLGSIVVLDETLFRRVVMSGAGGVLLGLLAQSLLVSLAGLILGPATVLTLFPRRSKV